MYARVLVLKAAPSKRAEVEALADQAFAIMKSLPGFISVHFVISAAEDKYGSFSLWESQETALAAGESIKSKIAGAMEDVLSAPPTIEVFEVYKPG
jgi:heme-degrading monooxygenase HmoA